MHKFVPMITCWNELPYLTNLIPQFLEVSDEIHILDGGSSDGTAEWISSLNSDKINYHQREFDNCGDHFNYLLQKCPKDNTWVFNCTADELPTTFFFNNIRHILNDSDAMGIDRIFNAVYHLRGERTMSGEMGSELRIFRNDNNKNCIYCDSPHERLHGEFKGLCCADPHREFAFVHFKQADPKKIELWKTDYVEKGVYSLWDINRRLEFGTVLLPEFINYKINEKLRSYLKWN